MARADSIFIAAFSCLFAAFTDAAPITEDTVPLTAPESFQIMTPAESAEHRAKMATLTGESRERYRNEQYRKLRERAQAQGYELPEIPPWGRTDLLPPAIPPADSKGESRSQAQAGTRDAEIRQDADRAPLDITLLSTDDEVIQSAESQAKASRAHSQFAHSESGAATRLVASADTPQAAEQQLPNEGPPRRMESNAIGASKDADPIVMAERHEAAAARRKAFQARIDLAIEAIGQPPDYGPPHHAPRQPIGHPPLQAPYRLPCPWLSGY